MMKPFYEDEQATLYHADCRDVLPELEPIDLILTDPPYGMTAPKWDSVVCFDSLWAHFNRILNKD